jgi:hypothetical protein
MQREWDSYDPILDPTLTTMQCNANGAFGAYESPIVAGSKITAYWNTWPHTLGPVTVWLAACGGNCTLQPIRRRLVQDQPGWPDQRHAVNRPLGDGPVGR